MKKLIYILLLITATSGVSTAATTVSSTPATATEAQATQALTQAEANRMTARIYEIRELAKGELNPGQKHDLRKEVLNIRNILSAPADGVYISVGALLVIIILLIILL